MIIALFGPTAVGKTEVAIALARRLRARGERPVAVSADALQVYRGLELLTGAAPSGCELEHRLTSFLPIDARFSVAEFAGLAHAEIDALLADGATPIVVGGTGLYLRAALGQLTLRPAAPEDVRARWIQQLERRGPEPLHGLLRTRAPLTAERINPADSHRIVRALELHEIGALEQPEGELWTEATRHPTRLIGLVRERAELYARIDARVERMLEAGAAEQVRAAHAAGASQTARAALGFDELLSGDIDAMKRRTRNYAKRQLTWMRKLVGVEVFDAGSGSADELAARLA